LAHTCFSSPRSDPGLPSFPTRRSSDLVASDAAPLVEHTRQVVYLNDGEMVVVRRSGYEVKTIDNTPLEKEIHQLEWDLEQIEKGDRKSTRLNSSHVKISYAVFCLKKKK